MHMGRGPYMRTFTYYGEGERLGFEQFCGCTKQIIPKNLPMVGLIYNHWHLSVCPSVGVFLNSFF